MNLNIKGDFQICIGVPLNISINIEKKVNQDGLNVSKLKLI